jgi:hypothetical protein
MNDTALYYIMLKAFFIACPNLTSKFQTTAMFKNSFKGSDYSYKACRYVHIFCCIEINLSKCNGSWVVSIKQVWILNFNRRTYSYFWFPAKIFLRKCIHSLKIYQYTKIPWFHVKWWKFNIHLRSLNVRHFEMVEATGLKITTSRSSSMLWLSYWIL